MEEKFVWLVESETDLIAFSNEMAALQAYKYQIKQNPAIHIRVLRINLYDGFTVVSETVS